MSAKKTQGRPTDPNSSHIPSTREEGTGTEQIYGNQHYEDAPPGPGLIGGPATDPIPGSRSNPVDVARNRTPPANPSGERPDDGGESTLAGQSRELGGDRPT